MIADTIRERLEQSPFTPFIIRASSGQAYKVHDPALVVLMKTKLFIAEPKSDRAATVSYIHIASVDDNGNGRGHGQHRSSKRPK